MVAPVHFLDLDPLSAADLAAILDLAIALKAEWQDGGNAPIYMARRWHDLSEAFAAHARQFRDGNAASGAVTLSIWGQARSIWASAKARQMWRAF